MPGVTYEERLQFTRFGPMRLHILSAPKPDGNLYKLQPVLSNGVVIGRERVTTMQRRAEASSTVAGVNGDLFTWTDGIPSSGLIQDGVLKTTPHPRRSMVGVDVAGNLRVEKIAMLATWQGAGPASTRPSREPAAGAERDDPLHLGLRPGDADWGGHHRGCLAPFPAATPNTDLVGTVSEARRGGTAIPPGGAVLAARGTQGQRLAIEAGPGQPVTVRLILRPDWRDVPEALGGGPIIVRAGKPIFNALEDFSSAHLNRRHPRTAVGQRADGRIVMVVVDGRRPGYSAGMTNFELAQAMIGLGAVSASALDAGGSSTMAFDGQLLSRPSDGAERMVAESLNVTYYGVYAPKPEPSFSPNGDGAGERQTLAYKIVRPSTVTATLTGPGGASRQIDSGQRRPGLYSFNWTGRTDAGPEPEGRWRFAVTAVDAEGRTSSADRAFMLNNTLGFLTVQPGRAVVHRRRGGRVAIRFRLTRAARVTVAITSTTGQLLRVVRNAQAPAGQVVAFWNGRYPNRKVVFSGTYVAKVTAINGAGSAELARSFRVRRR